MKTLLDSLFKAAIQKTYGDVAQNCDALIQKATRAEYGDYQANFSMRLAKQLNKKPFEVALAVIANLDAKEIFKVIEPSGPGFINITFSNECLAKHLQALINDPKLGTTNNPSPQNVVVDYGSANIAKEMHVGHIRSIVIGDAIVRVLHFLGHHVIRQNHLGDWGTQFGMLIEYLYETGEHQRTHSVSDLDSLYKKAKQLFDADLSFAEKARTRVVALQNGDRETLNIWQKIVNESLHYFHELYFRLDVLMNEKDVRGESFYNPMLADVVKELMQSGLAENSDGAVAIFLSGFVDADKKPLPFIIRKKDGGYLYATTDLAAAHFRIKQLNAKRLIYVTDARQKQHFSMLFAALRQAGWATDSIQLEHIPFGTILGKDNKPFKTRTGESIKLAALLDEAENRAIAIAQAKNPALTDKQLEVIAHDIGIGALKYSDLRTDKIKDYVFDWDKLLSFDGNTAPYLQNAYVRIRSIFRKGEIQFEQINDGKIVLTTDVEHDLAIRILEFSVLIVSVGEDLMMHRLCDYLYELAATFHRFYENCPILSLDDKNLRDSRLLLAELTARTLKLGLDLLGIKTLEQM